MNKQYCYYTQFASSIISAQNKFQPRDKLLMPLLKSAHGELTVRLELWRMLKSIGMKDAGLINVSLAYEKAKKQVQSAHDKWKKLYLDEIKSPGDIQIMLLGRPYNVLSPAMNSHIPEIIEKLGVKTFFMDMLPYHKMEVSKTEELIKAIKWKFASKILYSAGVVAKTENLYPVLITSFKCTPDSFVIEYFKEILNARQKPYLILQLDEHDSPVGYETRIEAGIRAFRNHRDRQKENAENILSEKEPEVDANSKISLSKSQVWDNHIKSLSNEASQILSSHGIDFKHFSHLIQQIEPGENHFPPSLFEGAKS